jgi:FecR protein
MNNIARSVIFVAACVGAMALAPGGAKADKIGVASVVVNRVEGISGSNTRALAVGSDVFLNERIRTSEASTAQLLFLDKTSLSVGPHAELRLDRFVYNPQKGVGRVVINATQGAFRFITGSQNPTSYTIKTPVATLGIRGTILDILITGDAATGYTLTVVLDQCCAIITLPSGQVLNLTQPGTAYVLTSAGGVTGPIQWDGSIVDAGGGVTFPLYGWYFNGEPPPDGLPQSQIGSIDDLNAVIAQQLNNLGHGGGGGGGDNGNSIRH